MAGWMADWPNLFCTEATAMICQNNGTIFLNGCTLVHQKKNVHLLKTAIGNLLHGYPILGQACIERSKGRR